MPGFSAAGTRVGPSLNILAHMEEAAQPAVGPLHTPPMEATPLLSFESSGSNDADGSLLNIMVLNWNGSKIAGVSKPQTCVRNALISPLRVRAACSGPF